MMQQPRRPTVGDTVTIVRRIVARPGTVIDARAPIDSAVATLVAPPVLSREGDSVQIAYTVAVWSAGQNDLVLPGAVLVDPRGHVDTLPDAHVPLDVATLLPAAKAANTIAPQAARPWLPRADRSILPFAFLLPAALLISVMLQWQWRRRGPAMAPPAARPLPLPLNDVRINAWIAAGEARLALEHLAHAARDRADLADWQQRVAEARFAPVDDATMVALVREAWERLRPSAS
jgi:hypothetical protein